MRPWAIRVYYEDTDLGGMVYHANYLRYMERARTEWLRALGCEQDELKHTHRALFVVVNVELEFKTPARFNDVLEVDVNVIEQGRASVVVEQHVFRRGPSSVQPTSWLCRGKIRIACVDAETSYPRAIPDFLYAALIGD